MQDLPPDKLEAVQSEHAPPQPHRRVGQHHRQREQRVHGEAEATCEEGVHHYEEGVNHCEQRVHGEAKAA